MRANLRKIGIITATSIALMGTSLTLPTSADARWGGGWHGGGWHGGHGGWGWGGFGVGVGTGLLLGAATAPYYGGYYGNNGYYGGGPYYGYDSYPDYAYYEESYPSYAYYGGPYQSGYYGNGSPRVSYSYRHNRRPYYRDGGYAHAYSSRQGSHSYARASSREAGSARARISSREGATLRPHQFHNSAGHRQVTGDR
jgi:hypothetical protein